MTELILFAKTHPYVVYGVKTEISADFPTGEKEYKDTTYPRFSNLLCASRTLVHNYAKGTVFNEITHSTWFMGTCIRMLQPFSKELPCDIQEGEN